MARQMRHYTWMSAKQSAIAPLRRVGRLLGVSQRLAHAIVDSRQDVGLARGAEAHHLSTINSQQSTEVEAPSTHNSFPAREQW